ncbi:hypothetical protein X777_05980 [Ooceraea biroi]|uniref:Uncharacterized protein n=1 Tax=Ooceraea biroi TaxID=2015173 RepID=A0A026WDH8_OOCBI|nr:hypothetical protein X777_05980 [Ooceraea biroi]
MSSSQACQGRARRCTIVLVRNMRQVQHGTTCTHLHLLVEHEHEESRRRRAAPRSTQNKSDQLATLESLGDHRWEFRILDDSLCKRIWTYL